MPVRDEVLTKIRKKLGDENARNLLPGTEFSDDEINLAIDEGVDLFNEVEPESEYTLEDIYKTPAKLILLDAITLQLVYNKILYYMRNSISAQGEIPSVEEQRLSKYTAIYNTLLQQVRNRIIAWKVARNATTAFEVFDFGDLKDSSFW